MASCILQYEKDIEKYVNNWKEFEEKEENTINFQD